MGLGWEDLYVVKEWGQIFLGSTCCSPQINMNLLVKHIMKSNHHVNGEYNTNLLVTLQPHYIDTKAKSEPHFIIHPKLCHDLAKMHAKFGAEEMKICDIMLHCIQQEDWLKPFSRLLLHMQFCCSSILLHRWKWNGILLF